MDILRAKPFEEWASQGANGRRLINGCLAPIQLKVSKNALDLAATVLPRYGDNDKPSSWSTDAQRSSYPHPLRTIPKAIPPFMRPTFPKGVPPRSHISGINESNRLLTCFRAVETLRACRNSLTPSLVELYGQVTVSHRSGNLQLFTFADLIGPWLIGTKGRGATILNGTLSLGDDGEGGPVRHSPGYSSLQLVETRYQIAYSQGYL